MQVEFDTVAGIFREIGTGEPISNLQVRSVDTIRTPGRNPGDIFARAEGVEVNLEVVMNPFMSVTRPPGLRDDRRARTDRLLNLVIDMIPLDLFLNNAEVMSGVRAATELLRSHMTPPTPRAVSPAQDIFEFQAVLGRAMADPPIRSIPFPVDYQQVQAPPLAVGDQLMVGADGQFRAAQPGEDASAYVLAALPNGRVSVVTGAGVQIQRSNPVGEGVKLLAALVPPLLEAERSVNAESPDGVVVDDASFRAMMDAPDVKPQLPTPIVPIPTGLAGPIGTRGAIGRRGPIGATGTDYEVDVVPTSREDAVRRAMQAIQNRRPDQALTLEDRQEIVGDATRMYERQQMLEMQRLAYGGAPQVNLGGTNPFRALQQEAERRRSDPVAAELAEQTRAADAD